MCGRERFLCSLPVLLSTLISSAFPSSLRAEDWTTAYAGLGRTSYVAGEAVSPPFSLQWETTLPVPVRAPIVSGVLGHAYLSSEQLWVWAIKLSDGTVAWKHDEPRDPSEVKCYDALTGALKWTAKVDGKLIHTPQVGQTAVYVASSTGKLYAFSQADGKLLWTVEVGNPLTLPACDGGLVVVGSGSSLVAVSAATGAKVFTTDLGRGIVSHPVLSEDGAYATLGEAVVAVDRTGKVRWQATLPKPAWAPISVTKAGVVAASVDGGVKLLSRSEGMQVWETILAGTPNAVSGAGDVAYVGTRQGGLVGLRLSDGAKLWAASLDHGTIDGVGVSGGRVLVCAGKWVASLLPAPEAPGQVALAREGNNCRLSWAAPMPNGSAISAYRVWRKRGQNEAMVGTTSSCGWGEGVIRGEAGYRVSAVGANGAESARSAEVTLAKGEPLLLRVAVTPVPFDPRSGQATVNFTLRETSRVTWSIVDAEGKAVTQVAEAQSAAGPGSVVWDGRTLAGVTAEPGVYRVQLVAEASGETDSQSKAIPVLWATGGTGGGALAGPGSSGGATAAGLGGGGSASGAGASSTGGDNNGVRDHGVGEGRDGAGQGRGQGSEQRAR